MPSRAATLTGVSGCAAAGARRGRSRAERRQTTRSRTEGRETSDHIVLLRSGAGVAQQEGFALARMPRAARGARPIRPGATAATPKIENTVTAAKASGVSMSPTARISRWPSPWLEATNSPMTAPTGASVTASLMPAQMLAQRARETGSCAGPGRASRPWRAPSATARDRRTSGPSPCSR